MYFPIPKVIKIIAVAFVLAISYLGYRLYKYTTSRAKGVPKPKKVINDTVPEPTDTEPEVPADSVEWKHILIKNEKQQSDEEISDKSPEQAQDGQISIDDLPIEDEK